MGLRPLDCALPAGFPTIRLTGSATSARPTRRRPDRSHRSRSWRWLPSSPVLDLLVDTDDVGPVELRAEFPDFYPYVRPEVYATTLDLERHQNPFGKNLCLLGRRSDVWQ